MPSRSNRQFFPSPRFLLTLMLLILLCTVTLTLPQPRAWLQTRLFYLTGEEDLLKQLSGGTQYLLTRLQPPLKTADMVPVQHAGVNPYGVNTFLQNEVEPVKREKAMRLLAEAGFEWIRQEFPWEDIEIHEKGSFHDRRHKPYKSAWAKYDHIVDLAEQYEVQIIARLSNPPAWTRARGNEVGAFAPPDDVGDYGDFVETLAKRYQGRIQVYQIWNEPNIYPEWGLYPINAAEYVTLLKEGYTRIKAVDPKAIIVMGALAATIELDRQRREGISPGGLSDVHFLQQVYDVGGGDYFDVLAMQGYGLWSGPYDRRMQPRVLNFSRPLYVRDVMVRNGDAHKPIWLSEMAWNAVPLELGIPPIYGHVSPEKQAEYAVLAYQRLQQEWPWLGVANYWFLKQATDQELKDGNPQYFFRLLEPDFTPMPVYEALKEANRQPSVLYRGYHQEDHWAITYEGKWTAQADAQAVLGQVMESQSLAAAAIFTMYGNRLTLVLHPKSEGQLRIRVGDDFAKVFEVTNQPLALTVFNHLRPKTHKVTITHLGGGPLRIDGVVVEDRLPSWLYWSLGGILILGSLRWLWGRGRG